MPEKAITPANQPYGELVENVHAPEIFATAASSFSFVAGVLTVTFASSRVDNSVSPPVRRNVVVFRVSMPISSAADLAAGLTAFMSQSVTPPISAEDRGRMQ